MKKNNYFQSSLLVAVLSMSLLSSCSVFSPVKTAPQTNYVLNKLPQTQLHRKSNNTLLVMPTQNNPLYDTRQIAYTNEPYQIGYYANHTWAERPSDMINSLLVQALQNTHHYHAIVTSTFTNNYNYVLNTEIVELLQDYTHNPGKLHLKIRAQLLRGTDNSVIASKEFVVTRNIYQVSPYDGVVAANAATAEMLRELTQFCLRYT